MKKSAPNREKIGTPKATIFSPLVFHRFRPHEKSEKSLQPRLRQPRYHEFNLAFGYGAQIEDDMLCNTKSCSRDTMSQLVVPKKGHARDTAMHFPAAKCTFLPRKNEKRKDLGHSSQLIVLSSFGPSSEFLLFSLEMQYELAPYESSFPRAWPKFFHIQENAQFLAENCGLSRGTSQETTKICRSASVVKIREC